MNSNTDTFQWDEKMVEELIWEAYGKADVRLQIDLFKEKHKSSHQEERGWEIVHSWDGKNTHSVHPYITKETSYKGSGQGCNTVGCEIYSVRRLSDGEVFSVGDEIKWGRKWIEGNDTTRHDKIISFFIDSPKIWGDKQSDLYINTKQVKRLNFEGAIDLSKYNNPIPLFKDHLGNDVFEGDSLWLVSEGVWLAHEIGSVHTKEPFTGIDNHFKYFKNEQDAEDYIKNNKPIFSIKNIEDILAKNEYTPNTMWNVFNDFRTQFDILNNKK